MSTSSLPAPVYSSKEMNIAHKTHSFLTMTPPPCTTHVADIPILHRQPQSPRHFFEKLYGHLETTAPVSPVPNGHLSQSAKHEVDSVVLSRSLLLEHQNSQLDLMASRTPVHSPPHNSNMSGSSADVSDTRYNLRF